MSDLWEGVLPAGGSGVVGRLRLRHLDPRLTLDTALALQTNVTRYVLPLAVYSGHLEVVTDHNKSYTFCLNFVLTKVF